MAAGTGANRAAMAGRFVVATNGSRVGVLQEVCNGVVPRLH